MDIDKFRVNIQPTLAWLKAGAPHVEVGRCQNVGFNMASFIERQGGDDYKYEHCGTTCCIAGHIALSEEFNSSSLSVESFAASHLGLNPNESYSLFYANGSPVSKYLITAEMAVWVIEYAMRTGEIYWYGVTDMVDKDLLYVQQTERFLSGFYQGRQSHSSWKREWMEDRQQARQTCQEYNSQVISWKHS